MICPSDGQLWQASVGADYTGRRRFDFEAGLSALQAGYSSCISIKNRGYREAEDAKA